MARVWGRVLPCSAASVRAECDHLVARAREVLAANGDYADRKLA